MAISYTQVASAGRPAMVAHADQNTSVSRPHFLARAASGIADLFSRWIFAQVRVLPGSSDQVVARAAKSGHDHYDTIKWNLIAQHYGGRQIR